MDDFSITAIIPCYNRQATIIRSVTSVLKQMSLKDRMIIVDDCSTDDTLMLLDKIKDSRIKIISNKINKGVSYSRNIAIDKLETKLVVFIDSDDYIDDGYFNKVRECFFDRNIQIVISGFTYIDESLNTKNRTIPKNSEGNLENRIISLDLAGLLESSCNKVYLTDVIKNNNIIFNEKVKIMEDYEFNLNYFKYVKENNMLILQNSWYNYIYHGNNSESSTYCESLYSRYIEIKDIRAKFYSKEIDSKVQELNDKMMLLCLNNLYKNNKLKTKERINKLQDIIKTNDFKMWQTKKIKSGVFQKIIYYATITNNIYFNDTLLCMMHCIKNKSKLATKIFRSVNRR